MYAYQDRVPVLSALGDVTVLQDKARFWRGVKIASLMGGAILGVLSLAGGRPVRGVVLGVAGLLGAGAAAGMERKAA